MISASSKEVFEDEKYRPHETGNFHEENFACYEEDETHRYPRLFHTENPQLNNIACMLAHIIKNCCFKNFTNGWMKFKKVF